MATSPWFYDSDRQRCRGTSGVTQLKPVCPGSLLRRQAKRSCSLSRHTARRFPSVRPMVSLRLICGVGAPPTEADTLTGRTASRTHAAKRAQGLCHPALSLLKDSTALLKKKRKVKTTRTSFPKAVCHREVPWTQHVGLHLRRERNQPGLFQLRAAPPPGRHAVRPTEQGPWGPRPGKHSGGSLVPAVFGKS